MLAKSSLQRNCNILLLTVPASCKIARNLLREVCCPQIWRDRKWHDIGFYPEPPIWKMWISQVGPSLQGSGWKKLEPPPIIEWSLVFLVFPYRVVIPNDPCSVSVRWRLLHFMSATSPPPRFLLLFLRPSVPGLSVKCSMALCIVKLMPHIFHVSIQGTTSSDILSGISSWHFVLTVFLTLFDISSEITFFLALFLTVFLTLFLTYLLKLPFFLTFFSHSLSGTSSDTSSDKSSDKSSDISFWDIFWRNFFHLFWHSVCYS